MATLHSPSGPGLPGPDGPEPLSPRGLEDALWRLRESFSYRRSWPGGGRWTVLDGSGLDDDVLDMFDTEAEAAAAVRTANLVRLDALAIAASIAGLRQPVPALKEPVSS